MEIIERCNKLAILLAFIGLSCGVITAGGIFGLITKLRLITRFADATKTIDNVKTYETAILVGATLGNVIYLFPISIDLPLANILFILFIFFSGMFVGSLAMALSETLNVTSVFTRRLRLHSKIELITISIIIGKLLGSFFYFLMY